MVILTGDIHTSWANDLPLSGYDANTGANSAGVEFVSPSVTSQNIPFSIGTGIIQLLNRHVKFIDVDKHGYIIFDINKQRAQSEWYFVNKIDVSDTGESLNSTWKTDDASRHLSQGTRSTPPPSVFGVQAPLMPRQNPIGLHKTPNNGGFVIVSAYPNPTTDYIEMQYSVPNNAPVQITISDVNGKIIFKNPFTRHQGLHHQRIYVKDLPTGTYFLSLQSANYIHTKRFIKN